MCQKGLKIINYVDDFIEVATPNVARRSFDALRQLMHDLGLDVSQNKLVAPGTVAVYLGIEINTVTSTTAIPAPKLNQIKNMVREWTVNFLDQYNGTS